MASPYLVLSCDGGGARGLVGALLLRRLEADTGFLSRVDLFAGTSTGGATALRLAAGVPVDRVVEGFAAAASAFRRHGPPTRRALPPAYRPVLPGCALSSLPQQLLGVKYRPDEAADAPLAGKRLADLPRRVLVTAFRLDDPAQGAWTPLPLHTFPGSPTAAVPVADAMAATGALPVYFAPHLVPGLGMCVDGGLYANHPGMLAVALAARHGVEMERVRVLSVGTGLVPDRVTPGEVALFGGPDTYSATAWLYPARLGTAPANPLLAAALAATSWAGDFQCRELLGPRYRRVDVRLPLPVGLDEHDRGDVMRDAVDALVASPAWEETVAWVRSEFTGAESAGPDPIPWPHGFIG